MKDGNSTHAKEAEAEDTPGGKNQKEFEEVLPEEKKATQAAIEKMMSEPSGGGGPVIAVVGSVPGAPQAGMPLMVVPGGYTATQRRPIGVGIAGGAYDELNMIGVGYVVEQSTKLRQSPAMIDPSMYRCAHTEPAEPFASRGHCNPDAQSIKHEFPAVERTLSFPLEATSVASLEELMNSGQLTSKKLVKAELYRIGLTNADGPAIQAVRDLNPDGGRRSRRERPQAQRHEKGRDARAAGGHSGARQRLDRRERAADERRLDRPGGRHAGERLDASSRSSRRPARSCWATPTWASWAASSTRTCRRATPRSAARCYCRPTPTSRSAAPLPARPRRCRWATRRSRSARRPRRKPRR